MNKIFTIIFDLKSQAYTLKEFLDVIVAERC